MRGLRQILWALAGVVFLALAAWQTAELASRHYLSAGAARAETGLRLTMNALAGYLARYEAVPPLLADLDAIRLLAAMPADPVRRAGINRILAERTASLGSSDIYIMDMTGMTIAASNHARPDSFIGQNFSYRPYFYDAAKGNPARFYALGTTSGVRGYYFSAPIRDPGGRIAGVIAVKIGVETVEASWRGGEYHIFVTDPEGIVFMSSEEGWLYGGLYPLTADRLERTAVSRRYSDARLHELPFASSTEYGVPMVQMTEDGIRRDYVAAAQDMPDAGWTVHVLLDSAEMRVQARMVAGIVVLLLCLGGFLGLVLMQRRARVAERLRLQAEARQHLEDRVEQRTAELALTNSRLEREVAERVATEAELRAAQANLVRVGKLAALGQMSAALQHEINQPLAAARNYADSAAILIERGDMPRAKENIGQILALIDRMAAIGRHLRNAARKPNDKLGAVSLVPLLAETQTILAGRLAAAKAVLELDVPADLPPLQAGPTRLQQILVNLIGNAADAAEGAEDRRITLAARVEGDTILLRIRDRGPGVSPAIAERIFDPFFTTKGVGAGLGLGLSITYNIIRDFGGEISVHDASPGAEFRVRLRMANPAEVAA